MKTVTQRVQYASVTIDGVVKSKIGKGLLILVGIEDRDTQEDINWLCKKICNLRIFDDEQGVMNRLDPQELLTHYPAPPVPDPYTAVRRLRLREAALQQPEPAAELPQGTIPVHPTRFF